jgi:hypothetical protein
MLAAQLDAPRAGTIGSMPTHAITAAAGNATDDADQRWSVDDDDGDGDDESLAPPIVVPRAPTDRRTIYERTAWTPPPSAQSVDVFRPPRLAAA